MARLFLIMIMAVAFVAIVAILLSVWNAAAAAMAERRSMVSSSKGSNIMAPTGFQKISFVALIAVLIGVSSGLLGGM